MKLLIPLIFFLSATASIAKHYDIVAYGAVSAERKVVLSDDAFTKIIEEISASADARNVIYIPAGVYHLSKQVLLKLEERNGISIRGDGAGLSILHWVKNAESKGLKID